jgi:transposase
MTDSRAFRPQALKLKAQDKLSFEATAKRFGMGKASLIRWSKPRAAKKTRNQPAPKIDRDALRQAVEHYPDAYPPERAKRFGISQAGMRYALKRLGISRQKNLFTSESR